MAQQALTASALAGGRLMLGVGLSHQFVIEQIFSLATTPVRHMREYLSILRAADPGPAVPSGETLALGRAGPRGAPPCPILVAALGPQMLELAGELADGTITG